MSTDEYSDYVLSDFDDSSEEYNDEGTVEADNAETDKTSVENESMDESFETEEEPEMAEEPEGAEEEPEMAEEDPEATEDPEVTEEEPEGTEEPEAEEDPEATEEPEAEEEPEATEEPEMAEEEPEGTEEPEAEEEPEATEEPEAEEELEATEEPEATEEEPEATEEEPEGTEEEPEGEEEKSEDSNFEDENPEEKSEKENDVDDSKDATETKNDATEAEMDNVATTVGDETDGGSEGDSDGDNSQASDTGKTAIYDNVSYHQGQNDFGARGTCGPTSIANSLNRVTGTSDYTENAVLHNAMDNDLCSKSENPNAMGGTTTNNVVSIIDNVKNPDSNIHTEVYEYDKALSIDELANRIDNPGTVAMVGVDSATLWDQRGDVASSGLFQHTYAPSDHWITVDSPTRDSDGDVTGFNIIDSGGGVDYVDRDKFEAMYQGDANHTVSDPTAIIISNQGDATNTYETTGGVERTSNYKGSAVESDGGDPPSRYSTAGMSEVDVLQIDKAASELGTEHTWNEFKEDPNNQMKYSSLEEARDTYQRLIEEQSPWPDGETPEFTELPVGTRFEMAMSPEQPDNRPGGFGTLSHIEDKEYVRTNLAVKEDWKPDIDRVNTYEVVKPLPVNVGEVGPQVDVPADRYLPGGADQIEMKVHPAERMQYIRFVSSRKVE